MNYPVVINGVGPTPCRYMIVGEAPGRKEIEQGAPFVGRSGILLNDALSKASISRKDVYITNAFKGDVGEGNRNPTDDELQEHLILLEKELDDVDPERILLLGSIAFRLFVQSYPGKLSDLVGHFLQWRHVDEEREKERLLFPCWHPSYILRGQSAEKLFKFYNAVEQFINYEHGD